MLSIIVAEAGGSVVCSDIGAIGQIVIISPQRACASGRPICLSVCQLILEITDN